MHGNLAEWCSDWWADSYANLSTVDPQGPLAGGNRLLRGGSWYAFEVKWLRSAVRFKYSPAFMAECCGFRAAMDGN